MMRLCWKAFPAPVHVVLTGEADDWDRRLVITNAPAFAIVGEPVTLFLAGRGSGRCACGGGGIKRGAADFY